MSEKSSEVVRRYVRGERVKDIAAALSISRARVYQLIQEARDSGANSVHVQIQGVRGDAAPEEIAEYLRRALATAGYATHKQTG